MSIEIELVTMIYIYCKHKKQNGIKSHPHLKTLPWCPRIKSKRILIQVAKLETWHIHIKLAAEIKRGFLAVSDQRYELDNYINHITKEEQLKKIFYSDHYYNYERDQRIMQNLPEPKPEKRRPRKKVI